MTEIAWATIREQTVEKFHGQLPRAEDEDRVITHWEHNPTVVEQAINEIAQAANVKWKWSALAARLDRDTSAPRNPVITSGPDRANQIAKADTWMRNAGRMFDRWSEIEDELFGDRGMLHPWRHQPKLVDHVREAWETNRPIGEQIEAEELERANRWKQTRPGIK
jgi:hypothetical protein